MHHRANKLRDELGSKQWDFDNENTIEEDVYYKERSFDLEIPPCLNCGKINCKC